MKLYAENLLEGQKNQYIFKTRTHNLETLASIYKKSATPLQTSLLRNCEKFLVCHPKIGAIYTKIVATEKHRFAASKEA